MIEINSGDSKTQTNSSILKGDLLKLKGRLESIETQLHSQMTDLEEREAKWKRMDEQAAELIKKQNNIVKFNVSGKKFATRIDTLLGVKDTLFYKMILSEKFDLSKEIFFDRSFRMFSVILDYLRYKKVSWNRFSKDEAEDLRIESDYFEISEISDHFHNKAQNIDFVSFQFNGPYIVSNNPVGTNKVEDLKDRSMTKGICALSPGWIIIELNSEWDIDQIDIGGFKGNTNSWGPTNGASAQITTSLDMATWVNVGSLPGNYGNDIINVRLGKSKAKFIKFTSTGYLGIGFLDIKQ